jgi:hypothetical protein
MNYTDYESANILIDGFTYEFKINYTGPRTPVVCKNLKSIYQYPDIALQKIQSEIEFGRIMGPFSHRPISNLRCSSIGIVPKKNGRTWAYYTSFIPNRTRNKSLYRSLFFDGSVFPV